MASDRASALAAFLPRRMPIMLARRRPAPTLREPAAAAAPVPPLRMALLALVLPLGLREKRRVRLAAS